MVRAIKLFLALATIEGIIGLIWLLAIPPDPKTAWLFGYSRYRIIFILSDSVGTAIFTGLFVRSWLSPGWTEWAAGNVHAFFQNQRWKIFFWVTILVILFLGTTALWIGSKDHWTIWVLPSVLIVRNYLTRLAPLLFWLVFLCIQSLIMLWLLGYKVRLGYMVTQILSVLIFPGLMIFFTSLHPNFYREINKEDHIIEWLTVVFLILSAVLAIIHALIARRRANHYVWFFILFAIACIFFAIEEISWGQRVFGLESSEYFLEHSDQQEINVHNIVNEQFSVRTKHIAAWALLAYGVVLPMLARSYWVFSFVKRLGIVIPPLVLIPGFIFASVMTWDRYFNGQDEEVAEFFFSILIFLVMVFQFWRSRPKILSME
jgi:hypothetical protein